MKHIFAALLCGVAVTSAVASRPSHTDEVGQYLDWMYQYMPVADSIDHPADYWRDNIELSLEARRSMPWGATVPEREFRHFVLPVRVNNEDLDSSRTVFYRELAPRVRNLSMKDAVLETNRWCHEKVTYSPSDGRTSSPLASVRTTLGRCGEESTFAVAALRSIGIPARQVYTPRWAHTDDNHAWVEVWVDGQWHFIGACEPEPVLDLAWFNAPAARGILMGTNVFGHYDGPEQKLYTDKCYTRINVTSNYAPVDTVTVTVRTPDGKPADDATVVFGVYNYAEFYPVYTTAVDASGSASLVCGLGDLAVLATTPSGLSALAVGRGHMELTPTQKGAFTAGDTAVYHIVPPQGHARLPEVTETMVADNDRRKQHEDSIRNARMATFFNAGTAADFISGLGSAARSHADALTRILTGSYGNHGVWTDVLTKLPDGHVPALIAWVSNLSDKDLRDIPAEVIEDAFLSGRNVNPRIANELLTPFNGTFDREVPASLREAFTADPDSLVRWTAANIASDKGRNPNRLCISPAGVWRSRVADTHSRDIFFVAMSRWLGQDARIDPVTGQLQRRQPGGEWTEVTFGTVQPAPGATGTLVLTYPTGELPADPKYYTHFTVQRLNGGRPAVLEYPEEATAATFADGVELAPGEYILSTGRRNADGSVLSRLTRFDIEPGRSVTMPLVLERDTTGLSVIGSMNADPWLPLTGRGFFGLAFISPGQEPTEHLLNELCDSREAVEACGRKILLMFADGDAAARLSDKRRQSLPANVIVVDKPQPELLEVLCSQFGPVSSRDGMPAVVVADSFNRIVNYGHGYNPGSVARLTEMLTRLGD